MIFARYFSKMSSIINKVSGGNYMQILSQITGVITSIDDDYWVKQNALLDGLSQKLTMRFITDPPTDKPHFEIPFITVEKKKKVIIKTKQVPNPECIHSTVVNTRWFKVLCNFHANVSQLIERLFPDKPENITFIPNIMMGQRFNGHDLSDESEFNSLMEEYKAVGSIINLVLTPSYDVRAKIRKSDALLRSIFKDGNLPKNIGFVDPDANTGDLDFDQIVNIVYYFVLAEYRSKIMNDSKGYVKVFLKTVGSAKSINNMSGAKFADFISALDLDKCSSSREVKEFAAKAGDILRDIDSGKSKATILKSIDDLLNKPIDDTGIIDEDGVEM